MSNVLVSSAGRRGHLVGIMHEVVEKLGGGAVVAVDASPLSAAGLLADVFELVPPASDPGFIDCVLEICSRNAVRFVVPTIDPELMAYSNSRSRFRAQGCEVWVSAPEVITLGRDKWLFHNWLGRNQLPSPETAEVRVASTCGIVGPVVAKPRAGSSSVGIMYAPSVSALPLDRFSDDYIIQQRVAGYEVTIDFAVSRTGRLLGLSARRRLEVRAGEVSKAVTIDHPSLKAAVERLVSALPGPFGVLNVQAFVNDDRGEIHFIELNPRFGGGFPLAWEAGARFPIALTSEVETTPRTDARPGLVMLRYDDAVFADAASFGSALL